MHTCYKIYGYFEFQFFTYFLSSVVHSATLTKTVHYPITRQSKDKNKQDTLYFLFKHIYFISIALETVNLIVHYRCLVRKHDHDI